LSESKKVLEIGCGTGNFTEIFSKSGATIIAVDISADLLKIARARNLNPEKVKFIEKPFEECTFHGPFDAIIGSSVLHHLDIVPTLKKMYNLLKPSGTISFAEPNYLNPQIFIERKFRRWFPSVSPDETAILSWKLSKELQKCGYVDIDIKPFDWLHPATPKRAIKIVNNISNIMERIAFLKNFAGSLYIKAKRK
jgi:SAM-dependent methyltransferase